jgi:hypothetical protein
LRVRIVWAEFPVHQSEGGIVSVTLGSVLPREVLQLQEAIDPVGLFLAAGGDCSVDTMTTLLKNAQQVEALALRQVALVDMAGTWIEFDASGVHNLVRESTGCTDGSARATVRLARRLEQDLRPVGDLLREGRITRAHAAAIVHGVRGLDADIVASSLEAICAAALSTDPVRLGAELRERAEAISDQLAQEQRRKIEERKGVTLDETPSGAWLINGLLSPEEGTLLNDVLDKRMAADRLDGDTRSNPRRRHDGMIDIFRHYADCSCTDEDLPRQGSNRAQVVIVASSETVAGVPGARPASLVGTDNGLLTRAELLRMMCDADISTVTLSSEVERIDFGRTTRTVSKGQWAALCVRDRKCVVKGCRRRPSQCQAHHVIWWRNGGTSDLGNYVLLCHAHHHALHDRGAWLSLEDDRLLTPSGFLDAWDPPPRTSRP